jgi:hypothetical protein
VSKMETETPTPVRQFSWEEINSKPVLDRFEAAFFTRLSQRGFDDRIGTIFPHFKIGRRTLFLKSSLLAAMQKLERKANK